MLGVNVGLAADALLKISSAKALLANLGQKFVNSAGPEAAHALDFTAEAEIGNNLGCDGTYGA